MTKSEIISKLATSLLKVSGVSKVDITIGCNNCIRIKVTPDTLYRVMISFYPIVMGKRMKDELSRVTIESVKLFNIININKVEITIAIDSWETKLNT